MKYRIVLERDDHQPYPKEIRLPEGVFPPKNLYFKPVEAAVTIDIYSGKSKINPFLSGGETLNITKEGNLIFQKSWFRHGYSFSKETKKKLKKATRIKITIDYLTYKPTTKKDLIDEPTKKSGV